MTNTLKTALSATIVFILMWLGYSLFQTFSQAEKTAGEQINQQSNNTASIRKNVSNTPKQSITNHVQEPPKNKTPLTKKEVPASIKSNQKPKVSNQLSNKLDSQAVVFSEKYVKPPTMDAPPPPLPVNRVTKTQQNNTRSVPPPPPNDGISPNTHSGR